MRNPPFILDFSLKKIHLILSTYFPWLEKGKYCFSFPMEEFLICCFVTQPSDAIAKSSEVRTDSWETWRIPADSRKPKREQEREETDGCGMGHNLFKQRRCSRRERVSAALPPVVGRQRKHEPIIFVAGVEGVIIHGGIWVSWNLSAALC